MCSASSSKYHVFLAELKACDFEEEKCLDLRTIPFHDRRQEARHLNRLKMADEKRKEKLGKMRKIQLQQRKRKKLGTVARMRHKIVVDFKEAEKNRRERKHQLDE